MIGGLVALALDKSVLRQLGEGRRTIVVTGTNGKSTTTRMTAAALGTLGAVATNAEGANMDAGLVAALGVPVMLRWRRSRSTRCMCRTSRMHCTRR
jgi:UDP-N-acetylmuramyl tripeptide synthase